LSGGADGLWPNALTDTADLAGAAGTVTLASTINAEGLIFDTANYTIATGANVLTLGTSGIAANPVTGTTTISGTGSLTVNSTGTTTLSANNTYADDYRHRRPTPDQLGKRRRPMEPPAR
jgi:hypothetical protein